ncbi:decarboxylating NADP(+)-dependent phosphogluconate dehydrogenase [Rhabdochlamydiaceae symbiont of Dictyostelium giganteum]|uniref:decarboxylating NADP(+)-dependent phosphogluconate dehydrogenase n=1 Tax=Rhabdochlamydiaceae symbiont of Dictyostelium giganteum TaxID=3342349 RepID=UPI00384FE69F
MEADIGLIGLAVMGQNLVLNLNDHGYTVAVYNRTVSKVDEFMEGTAKGSDVIGAHSLQEFFLKLKRPRKVMLMVKAGAPVDALIDDCLPFLESGDILIDGGNSLYSDTERRVKALEEKGIFFLGMGVSGGEEGARHGPSMMPGGNIQAWPFVKEMFQKIAAKADDGASCADWVGDGGSGHYVKMIHNGIEYGDMQLIAEAYQLLKDVGGCTTDELSTIFSTWNQGKLSSYLIEITANIFKKKDINGAPLLESILDVAGQKGTGKWTGINALELGIPVTLIAESVFARYLSSLKEERKEASLLYSKAKKEISVNKIVFTEQVMQALYASKIVSYAQGFMLMQAAAHEMKWTLHYETIALLWRGGCIIRSQFLGQIQNAFAKKKDLASLLLDSFFQGEILECIQGWRDAVSLAIQAGVAAPALSSALAFFDGYTTAKLPSNLIQAQRDFFGAHTYERIDKPRGEFFHTEWSSS